MLKKISLMIGCLMVMSVVANATTITFQDGVNGYDGTKDVQHYGYGVFVNYNVDEGAAFQVGSGNAANPIQSLLRFDGLSAMAGSYASIDSAWISLIKADSVSGNPNFNIDVLQISNGNAGWIQGTGGFGTAATGESSWNNRVHPSTPWIGGAGLAGAGGTAGSIYSLAVDPAHPQHTLYNILLPTSLVEQWITGVNAGLLLRMDPMVASSLAFRSSEFTGGNTLRPKLTINYTVPEPATMALLSLGGLLLIRKKRQ